MVTRHRIKPGRKGGKYVLGNVAGLCPNCHVLAEQGYYTQYELFKIVQLRIQQSKESPDGYIERSGVRTTEDQRATST